MFKAHEPDEEVTRAAVLGGGAFGTAMAQVLARNDVKVKLWALEADVVESINTEHKNRFLKDCELHENIWATSDMTKALEDIEMIMIVIPTPYLRQLAIENRASFPVGVPLVCCTKGIENDSLKTPYEILIEELPGKYHDNLAVLSGPSFAREVALGMPTSVLVASPYPRISKLVQVSMSDSTFRIFTGEDLIGAEFCGAMKNVIAISCGMSAGLGFGHDSTALLITQGLAELSQVAIKKGGKPSTMMGLAGIGDLVLTCTSTMSRNYTVGHRIAKGETLEEITNSVSSLAEGVKTSLSVHTLAAELGLELPLCETVYKVLWKGVDIREALVEFGARPLMPEFNPYEFFREEILEKDSKQAKL